MKYRLQKMVWILAVVIMVILAGCQSTANGTKVMETIEPEVVEADVIFRVGEDRVVTKSDFEQRLQEDIAPALEQFLAQGQTREEIVAMAVDQNIRGLIFDRMIQEELLLNLAREEGVGVDTEAVDKEVQQQQGLMAMQSQSKGEGEGMSDEEVADLRATLSRQQLVLQMIAKNTRTDRFRSRHILLSVDVPITATEEEKTAAFDTRRAEAEEVLEQVRGGADFAELAKEKSEDPGSATQGGDLGWVTRGVFVPEFESAALTDTTELNEPILVESDFGFHIIEVQERKLDAPFDDVEELRALNNAGQIVDESFTPWYEEYRQKAEDSGLLEVNESFDPQDVPLPFPDDMPATEDSSAPSDGEVEGEGMDEETPASAEETPAVEDQSDGEGMDEEDAPASEEDTPAPEEE